MTLPSTSSRVPLEQNGVPLLYPRYNSLEALQQGATHAKANAATANAMAETARKLLSERKRKAAGGDAVAIPGVEAHAAEVEAPGPSSEAVALDRPLTKLEIKRAKRAARRQNQPAEGAGEGAEEAAAGTQATAAPAAAASAPKKHSGEGNADEAQRIRAALGYVEADPAAAADTPGPSAAAAPPAKKAKGVKGKKGAAAPAEAEGGEAREDASCSQAAGASQPDQPAAARPLPGGKFGFGFQLAQQQEEARAEEKIKGILMVDSAKDGYVPRRVFICGMPHEYDEAMIREYWSYCGEIESMELLYFPDTGNFNGVMFITFATEDSYQAALACNGEEVEGRFLRVERCKAAAAKKAPQQGSRSRGDQEAAAVQRVEGYNVAYIGNIAYDVTREDLIELFRPYKSTLVRLHTDKDTGKPKGYAHVHFPDAQSLDSAMELNGHEMSGRCIKMSYAQPKKA